MGPPTMTPGIRIIMVGIRITAWDFGLVTMAGAGAGEGSAASVVVLVAASAAAEDSGGTEVAASVRCVEAEGAVGTGAEADTGKLGIKESPA